MRRPALRRWLRVALALLITGQAATGAEVDPCSRFTWDVSRELAVMQQSAQAVAAASKPGTDIPQLDLEKLYAVRLVDQSTVTFAAKPAKPTLDDGAQAGILRFHIAQAGRYRVSITSGHWLDVLDGTQTIASRDFQGQRGCERPRKIVEFELPAQRDLTLQLSGSTDAAVWLSITAVTH